MIKNRKNQKGMALYFSILIMALLLATGLGLTLIIFGQLRMTRYAGDSVVAFHAADTGIEHALYERRENESTLGINLTTIGDASYEVYHGGGGSTGNPEYWEATGYFKKEKRAVRIDQQGIFDFILCSYGVDIAGNRIPGELPVDFCAVAAGGATPDPACGVYPHLEAILIAGDTKPVTFFLRGEPAGITLFIEKAQYPIEELDLSVMDNGYQFMVNPGLAPGEYNFELVAHTAIKERVIPVRIEKMGGFMVCGC